MRFLIAFICFSNLFLGCTANSSYYEDVSDPELFLEAVQNLSDIIVYDIFSPPVASRVYVYPTIAAYQIIAQSDTLNYKSLSGNLNDLKSSPPIPRNVNPYISAIYAYNIVGKALIFSEDKMEEFQDKFDSKIKKMGVPRSTRKASLKYASLVANHILDWANNDLYNQTRTYPKYTILEEDNFWKPTPPDYMDGIEPHWNKIRTMVLDSADQFKPIKPLAFDLTKGSPFQIQLQEVLEIGETLTQEQIEIAQFWDCNPYVTHHRGHVMFATKKITPGGHWIGITSIASRKANSDFEETVNAFTHVSIALFDAFISCWDEKWDSLIVRPETLINEYYDDEWFPLLQTPPFPEYTSGHSVISRASAVVLTKLYGDDFSFEDTTEVFYGLPVRSFNSFLHASEEAAISRLYGGIHYRMAIEEGVNQGDLVGRHINRNISTRVEHANVLNKN